MWLRGAPRNHITAFVVHAASLCDATWTTNHALERARDTRLGITPQYCEPWVRQIENMALAVPPSVASSLPTRAQDLLYGIYPPFIGYVDGRDPRRLFETNARTK